MKVIVHVLREENCTQNLAGFFKESCEMNPGSLAQEAKGLRDLLDAPSKETSVVRDALDELLKNRRPRLLKPMCVLPGGRLLLKRTDELLKGRASDDGTKVGLKVRRGETDALTEEVKLNTNAEKLKLRFVVTDIDMYKSIRKQFETLRKKTLESFKEKETEGITGTNAKFDIVGAMLVDMLRNSFNIYMTSCSKSLGDLLEKRLGTKEFNVVLDDVKQKMAQVDPSILEEQAWKQQLSNGIGGGLVGYYVSLRDVAVEIADSYRDVSCLRDEDANLESAVLICFIDLADYPRGCNFPAVWARQSERPTAAVPRISCTWVGPVRVVR